jgi:hypothetical protein
MSKPILLKYVSSNAAADMSRDVIYRAQYQALLRRRSEISRHIETELTWIFHGQPGQVDIGM